MAEVFVRIGSMEDIHAYDDGDYDSAIETTAPMKAGAPVDPDDVVILGGGGAGSITPLSVANIDDPSAELNALAGVLGSFVLCFEVEAATNQYTIYSFDASDTGGEDVPYTVDALTSGLWVAVAGKYVAGSVSINSRVVTETLTTAVVGPTDNLNVSGVNTVFMDCSGGAVIIGGFVGGVNGQILRIARLDAAANNATLEHNEGTGNQDIFLRTGGDETLNGQYGGWTLVCNGSDWYDTGH